MARPITAAPAKATAEPANRREETRPGTARRGSRSGSGRRSPASSRARVDIALGRVERDRVEREPEHARRDDERHRPPARAGRAPDRDDDRKHRGAGQEPAKASAPGLKSSMTARIPTNADAHSATVTSAAPSASQSVRGADLPADACVMRAGTRRWGDPLQARDRHVAGWRRSPAERLRRFPSQMSPAPMTRKIARIVTKETATLA